MSNAKSIVVALVTVSSAAHADRRIEVGAYGGRIFSTTQTTSD